MKYDFDENKIFPVICGDTVTDAFENAYHYVSKYGEEVESRIGKTKHLTDVTFIVSNPYHNICLNKTRNMSLKYMLGEICWYMSGSNKVKDIAKYAKMWNNLTDDGKTVNSAYGYRIFHKFGFDQLEFVINKLKANPHDRQAVIHIKDADNKPTKDTPCTCLLHFIVYKGKLNLHVYMRSNDIWLGLPYDMAFFTYLLQVVSAKTDIPVGLYYHTVGDLHIYEKHLGKDVGFTTDEELEGKTWYGVLDEPEELLDALECVPDGMCPYIEGTGLEELWRINNGK